MSKKLVAYFSASGVTGRVAKTLAEAANADLYEIKPQIPYTTADLNWMDKKSRSTIEMQDKASRPAMADCNAPVADADVIFVGFPIWWYVAPHIINSFLEAYDFSGKTIVLFATSGGSDFGRTLEALEDSVRGTAHLMEGKMLNGKHGKDDMAVWIKSLNL
ncbi:flavodoxin [Bariatricus sp. HCP28S3_D3]|uniref:flavodoxin n=1 Tax=Bariatricus sp. HCP28S3_D3 TaxID=3438901 RepID=UPI003F8B8149